MSNANANSNSFRDKLDKTGGRINGELAVASHLSTEGLLLSKSTSVAVQNDGENIHYWLRDSGGNERAVIYHAKSTERLHMRAGSTAPEAQVDKEGNVWADRFVPRSTAIGFHATNEIRLGDSHAVVRGAVAGGTWTEWRARPAGIIVDAQNSSAQAHNIFKSVHWGGEYLCAMDVHRPGAGATQASLHLGGGQEQFRFFENGDAVAKGTWQAGSDIRFKEKIEPLAKIRTSWLEKVCMLNASSYKYKWDDKKRVGFIAQNVQDVIPEAVTVTLDTTVPEEQREGTDRLYIDPISIIAIQNEAIKELKTRLESLEKTVSTLLEKQA